MPEIIKERMFVRMNGSFVVFLLGMRINSFWKIHKWWPVAMAMPRMIKELFKNKEHGFISTEAWFGRTTIMVQYWKSFDTSKLMRRIKMRNISPRGKNLIRNSGKAGLLAYGMKAIKQLPAAMKIYMLICQNSDWVKQGLSAKQLANMNMPKNVLKLLM